MEGETGEEARSTSPAPVRFLRAPARLGGVAASLMILVILGLISWAVIARYFWNQPLPWADDLSGMLLVAMVGLGMAEALRRGDHIAIDIIGHRRSGRPAQLKIVWSSFAVLIFAGVLAWSTWDQIRFARDFGSYAPGEIEVQSWIPMLPLLLGWGLLAVTALGQLIEALAGRGRS